jgi:hypothetical protein
MGGTSSGGASGAGPVGPGAFFFNELYTDMCLGGDKTEWVEIGGTVGASTAKLVLRIFTYDVSADPPITLKYTVPFDGTAIQDNGLLTIGASSTDAVISVPLNDWGLPEQGYLQLFDADSKQLYDAVGFGDVPAVEADASFGAPLTLLFGQPAKRPAFDTPTCGTRTIARIPGSGQTDNATDFCIQTESINQPNDATCGTVPVDPPTELGVFFVNEIYTDMCLGGDKTEWVEIGGPKGTATTDLVLRIFELSGDPPAPSLKYTVPFDGTVVQDNGLLTIGAALTSAKISVSLGNWGLPEHGYLQLVDAKSKKLYDAVGFGEVPVADADAADGPPSKLLFGQPAARTPFSAALCGARTIARKAKSAGKDNASEFCVQLETINQPNDGTCQ